MSLPILPSFLPALRRRLAAPLLLLAFATGAALAQEADPPGRVARLGLAEGTVSVAEGDAGQNGQPGAWELAQPNRPLSSGDRVWTEPNARAELHVGSNALRLDGQTSLDIAQLDDQTAQLRLTQGRLSLRVRQLWDGERIEIGTPNLAVVVTQPGLYRVEVDPALGITRVAVAAGAATLYGENGASTTLQAAQQIAMGGRNLTPAPGQDVARQDPFERWVAERDRVEEQSIAARYVSRETIGYQQLDGHGDWQNDATYGQVWIPRVTIANWAPYRYGQWRWVAPWGWTWVDDAPWGFAPFHYGRWAQVGSRWAWVPGPRGPRPVYAPALVGFVGNPGGPGAPGHGGPWNIGANRPGVGWFPLSPGEAWRPGFQASPRYLANINRPGPAGAPRDRFAYQHRPDAVTAVTAADFEHGRPVRSHWQRVGEAELAGARLVAPPARDFGGRFGDQRGVEARQPRPGMSSPAAAIGAPLAGQPQTQLPGVQAVPPSAGFELQSRPPHGAWAGQPRERPPVPQQQIQPQGPTAEQQAQFQRAQMERQQREQFEQAQRQQQQAQFQRAQMERQQREQAEQGQRQQQLYQQQQAQREQFQRDRERQQRAEQEARTRAQAQQQNNDNARAQRQIERAQRGQVNPSGEQYRGQGS